MPYVHGFAPKGSPAVEYTIWVSMIARCCNPKNHAYGRYAGRGITICNRWRNSFVAFHDDMGDRPSPLHSLERKNNSQGYAPGNVVWATAKEQARNRRSNRLLTFNGETMCTAAWAERLGLSHVMVRMRLHRGATVEEALRRERDSVACRPEPYLLRRTA